jgi:hypothetical protein
MKDEFKNTTLQITSEVSKSFDHLTNSGSLQLEHISKANKDFLNEIIETNKLPEIIEKNNEVVSSVRLLVSENEENMKTLIKLTNQKHEELEAKLNNKKRGLFG